MEIVGQKGVSVLFLCIYNKNLEKVLKIVESNMINKMQHRLDFDLIVDSNAEMRTETSLWRQGKSIKEPRFIIPRFPVSFIKEPHTSNHRWLEIEQGVWVGGRGLYNLPFGFYFDILAKRQSWQQKNANCEDIL